MKIKFRLFLLNPYGVIFASMVVLGGCGIIRTQEDEDDEKIGVMISGVHHLGPQFNIADFYIDGYPGGNVGMNGGGGSFVCCSALPRKWRPGLVMKVWWSVNDWSKSIKSEIDAGNYKSVRFENFVAVVPVEQYDEVGNLYPHFFPDGKVRLISTNYPVNNPKHPVQWDDVSAMEHATLGVK